MKKLSVIVLVLLATTAAFAQKDSTKVKQPAAPVTPATKPAKKDWSKIKLANRANDHVMLQLGYDNWAGKPDTIQTTGFSRSFNFYFMYDMPFKTDPRFSVAGGLGIGCSNIFFSDQNVLVASTNPTLAFPSVSEGAKNFKKYKLVSTYLDIPVELRFALDPENTNSSWKFAVGVKVGILLSTYTKGKNEENAANQVINSYIEKESAKKYFNSSRLSPTVRISKGVFGIFAQYQITQFIKPAYGPPIYPFAAGIQISGL
jgi:Outer membrane protein beta-barrel domain